MADAEETHQHECSGNQTDKTWDLRESHIVTADNAIGKDRGVITYRVVAVYKPDT